MRMPNRCIELIKLNYRSCNPKEFNELFKLEGLRVFNEKTLQKKIDVLIQRDAIREVNRLKRAEKALQDPIKYRAATLLAGAKQRSKVKGIECTLTLDWIIDKLKAGTCECTGISFFIKPYSKRDEYTVVHPHSPSLDQIKPSKGYTPDNVQVVCDQFNKMKNDRSMRQTYNVAKAFVKFQRAKLKNKNKEEVIA